MLRVEEAYDKPHILIKIRAIICPMLGMFCSGSFFCFSNTNPYVAAYLNSKSPIEITDTDTLLVMPVWMIALSIFCIISVKLADTLGYWSLNLIAFALFALFHLLASLVTNYTLFIFVYGFLVGSCVGLGYLPSLYIAWTYFPNKKSIVTGSVLFCSGISGMILSPITTMIINPTNVDLGMIRDSPEVYNNVPRMFRIMSVIFGSIALVSGLLQPRPFKQKSAEFVVEEIKDIKAELGDDLGNNLKEELINDLNKAPNSTITSNLSGEENIGRNEEKGFLNSDIDSSFLNSIECNDKTITTVNKGDDQDGDLTAQDIEILDCPNMKTALLSWPFMNVCLLAFCCSIYNYFLSSCWKKLYPSKFYVDDSKMALLLTIGALSNSFFRFGIGVLLMYFSFKTIYIINIIIALLNSLTVLHFATSYNVGALYLFLAFGGVGVQLTVFPTICLQLFGPVIGSKIFPFVCFIFAISSMSQYTILKIVGEDWQLVINIQTGVTIIGLMLAIPFKQQHDWRSAIELIKKREEDEAKRTSNRLIESLNNSII